MTSIVESEIKKAQEKVKYNTVDYSLEYFLSLTFSIKENSWSIEEQSHFIESLLIGLPMPQVVIYDPFLGEDDEGEHLEIFNGENSLSTVIDFIKGNLKLEGLKILTSLNGFKFTDLVLSRQRRFKRITVKTIQIHPQSDLSYWNF